MDDINSADSSIQFTKDRMLGRLTFDLHSRALSLQLCAIAIGQSARGTGTSVKHGGLFCAASVTLTTGRRNEAFSMHKLAPPGSKYRQLIKSPEELFIVAFH
jgi:hypothetical protein